MSLATRHINRAFEAVSNGGNYRAQWCEWECTACGKRVESDGRKPPARCACTTKAGRWTRCGMGTLMIGRIDLTVTTE